MLLHEAAAKVAERAVRVATHKSSYYRIRLVGRNVVYEELTGDPNKAWRKVNRGIVKNEWPILNWRVW
jgi:hypothetical protein